MGVAAIDTIKEYAEKVESPVVPVDVVTPDEGSEVVTPVEVKDTSEETGTVA